MEETTTIKIGRYIEITAIDHTLLLIGMIIRLPVATNELLSSATQEKRDGLVRCGVNYLVNEGFINTTKNWQISVGMTTL